MAQYINKDVLVAKIIKLDGLNCLESPTISHNEDYKCGYSQALEKVRDFIDTLEVKEVGVWKTVDNINLPQADRNKIYCVLSKGKYLLAKVINHPHDELLQWCCTEFPFHCYDMCEGDKYMQIV